MKCPHCEVVLVISERQGIEIDYSPQCRGVWLDRGELDKIIERAELSSDRTYDSNRKAERFDNDKPGDQRDSMSRGERYDKDDYGDRYKYDKGYHHRKKRGGFLGDLFDFD